MIQNHETGQQLKSFTLIHSSAMTLKTLCHPFSGNLPGSRLFVLNIYLALKNTILFQ
jgi:hypothetical protein